MSAPVHYTRCPVCHSTAIRPVLAAKDHTVSGETFSIFECASCSLRFTQDVPAPDRIGEYYKAEAYISHTNTSKGLVNRLYKTVRKHTLKQKRRLIERITGKKTGRILDLGAGTGAFAHTMKAGGWTVTGLEPDAQARETAGKLFGIELQDISIFPGLTGPFDAITMWHVLEHVHDLGGYMDRLAALLAPEGKLFVAVPNYTSGDAETYGAFWAAWDVPRHLYHFSPAAMKKLVENHGLKIERYIPMWFDSYYVSLLSSRYSSGTTRMVSAMWHGLRSNMRAWSDSRKCSSVIYIIGR
jgi:SAM-dependent methyltransferase